MSHTFQSLGHNEEGNMKTACIFCLFFAALLFGCAHQGTPDTNEPESIFEEEESDEGYVMLTDDDVGISKEEKEGSDGSPKKNTSAIPSP